MIEPRLLKLIENLFSLLFVGGVLILAGMIIFLGIQYIVSSKKEAIETIHKRWKLILIGVVLIFLSFTIGRIIELFFK